MTYKYVALSQDPDLWCHQCWLEQAISMYFDMTGISINCGQSPCYILDIRHGRIYRFKLLNSPTKGPIMTPRSIRNFWRFVCYSTYQVWKPKDFCHGCCWRHRSKSIESTRADYQERNDLRYNKYNIWFHLFKYEYVLLRTLQIHTFL